MRIKLKRIHALIAYIFPPAAMLIEYVLNVYGGYRLYAQLRRLHGMDTTIYATTMKGTGDYYLCGMLLANKENDFVFLVGGLNELDAVKRFPFKNGQCHLVTHGLIVPNDRFNVFIGEKNLDFHWLHMPSNTFSVCGKRSGNLSLCGYRNNNMLDWYKRSL